MATLTAANTQTLAAATPTNDTVTAAHTFLEVVNQTAATVVYVVVGAASVPAVAGSGAIPVLGGTSRRFMKPGARVSTGTQIQMISAGTPVVTIIPLQS